MSTGMSMIRALFALTALLLGIIQVQGQFSNVPVNTQPVSGVSGLPASNEALAAQAKHPIKEALADAIVLGAEAKKEKILAKHGGQGAQSNNVAPVAKTKNFAYTSISVPQANNA